MFKKIILIIISILFLLIPSIVLAESRIIFAWDASTDPYIAGYKLYQSAESGVYLNNPTEVISAGIVTVTLNNVPDGTWFWVLTAYDDSNNESGFSNEVTLEIDTIAPDSPKNFKVLIDINVRLE